jgi:hypothetical protein
MAVHMQVNFFCLFVCLLIYLFIFFVNHNVRLHNGRLPTEQF